MPRSARPWSRRACKQASHSIVRFVRSHRSAAPHPQPQPPPFPSFDPVRPPFFPLVSLQLKEEMASQQASQFFDVSMPRLRCRRCAPSSVALFSVYSTCRSSICVSPPFARSPPTLLCIAAQSVRDNCFRKCVTKPGSTLTSGEVNCLAKCCDRYVDAMQLIVDNLQKN